MSYLPVVLPYGHRYEAALDDVIRQLQGGEEAMEKEMASMRAVRPLGLALLGF